MDTETFRTKLLDLNEDCLRHIFQYLSFEDKWRFYKVYSKWTHVSSGFWRISQFGVFDAAAGNYKEHLDLMPNRKLNFEEFREITLSCGATFQKLFIWLGNHLSSSTELVYSFDGTAYRIDGEFSYEATLDVLVEACYNLKTLNIHARVGHPHLSEKLHALFLANEKLAEIHLDCDTDTDLNDIVRLKDVHGPAKTLFLRMDIPRIPIYRNVSIICDLLESSRVDLKSLIFEYRNYEVANQLVQAVMNYAQNLRVFELTDMKCNKHSLLGLEKIAALEDLEELSINSFMNITNEVIPAITESCRKLKKINLKRIRIEDINTLMTSVPTLVSVSLHCPCTTSLLRGEAQLTIQSLKLDRCHRVSEDEFKNISVFPNLEELSINNYGCYTITDGVILAISTGCKKLKKVTLEDCYEITNEGMNTLMTTLPMLESVALLSLKINSIIHTNSKSSVRNLNISDCHRLSENALKEIYHFKNLEVLRLIRIDGTTDKVLSSISFGCKKLETVTLQSCSRVTSEGINTFIGALPNLETLELVILKLPLTFLKNVPESNLQRLLIYNDKDFPNGDLETLLSKMSKLKHVKIDGLV